VTGSLDLARVEVGDLRPDERQAAIGVVARAMCTSPMAIAVIRGDRERRRRLLERFFGRLYRVAHEQRPLVARLEGRVVASTNDLPGGACRFSAAQRLRALPDALVTPPPITARALRWLSDWERRDPDRPHSHYGPFGVEPELQGRGIGSLMMVEYTRRLDDDGEDAYLETDKPENVALYQRFGFEVIDESELFGAANWFMWREAGALGPGHRPR
jgi:GNAT superfamily N-acetyltransferase